MYIKKWIFFIISIILIISGCATGAGSLMTGLSLDEAITEAAVQISHESEAGSRIALINISSPSDRLSLYVLDGLSTNLVNTRRLTVVDRAEVDFIRNELGFQYSGEVDDSSIQEAGRLLGAQSIVTGSLMEIGRNLYRISIRVLNVQTGIIVSHPTADVYNDSRIQFFLGREDTSTAQTQRTAPSTQRNIAPAPVRSFSLSAARLNSIGISAGTSFSMPLLIGTAQGTYSFFNNTFLEAGFDFGIFSAFEDVGYYSFLPYINFAFILPVISAIDWYAGLGAGMKFSNYSFPEGDISENIFVMNAATGLIIMDLINISYTFRTNFTSVNNKLSLGIIKRFR